MDGPVSAGGSAGAASDGLRVECYLEPALEGPVRDTLHTWLPRAKIVMGDAAVRDLPTASCLVLQRAPGGEPAMDQLRRLRARGYAGGVVLLLDEPPDATTLPGLMQLGAQWCSLPGELGEPLADRLVRAAQAATPDTPLAAELGRTRQLVAAGALASQIPHALNNTLTALLAEAQLLALEELPVEHGTSVRRIVALCRRVIEVTRGITDLHEPRPALPGAARPDAVPNGRRA